MKVKIYGIIYGDKQTEYIPYFNSSTEKNWRFENNPIIDIIDNHVIDLSSDDLLGILSWRFPIKSRITKPVLLSLLNNAPKDGDVYNLSQDLGHHIHFMDWSDQGHKGIKGFIQRCCKHVDLEYNNDCKTIVYANYFLARKNIYVNYVNDVIKPCLELLEGEMWEEVNKNPGYTRAVPGVTYNYIPFILERMMMQYIFNLNLKTIQLV
jgi:hypothetical protein